MCERHSCLVRSLTWMLSFSSETALAHLHEMTRLTFHQLALHCRSFSIWFTPCVSAHLCGGGLQACWLSTVEDNYSGKQYSRSVVLSLRVCKAPQIMSSQLRVPGGKRDRIKLCDFWVKFGATASVTENRHVSGQRNYVHRVLQARVQHRL